jgi:methylated-DNA-[protein]-cysteine S-methyltransferase
LNVLESYQAKWRAPFAVLGIRTSGVWVTDIDYLPAGVATLAPLDRVAERVCRQLERYIDDPNFRFDLPFEYRGTAFQCKVWRAIASIPVGHRRTYSDVARVLRTAPRAVGNACGANRMPIVVPCHRVVAAQGLGGFMRSRDGFPLDIKKWLLEHEAG